MARVSCLIAGLFGLFVSTLALGSVSSGLVLLSGDTPVHSHELVLDEETSVTLAFTQLQIGGNPVSGEAILAQGASRLLVVPLNGSTSSAVTLAPGRYNLLAYVDLASESVAEVVLSANTVSGTSLYNEQLTVSRSSVDETADRVTVLQDFSLGADAAVTFSYRSFEYFDVANYFSDDATPPAVMISNSDGTVRVPLLLSGLSETQEIQLPSGNYTLTIIADIPEQAVSGFFWRLYSATESFGDKVVLNGTASSHFADVMDMGATSELSPSLYQVTSAWMLNSAEPGYAVFLENDDEQVAVSEQNNYQASADLSGDYHVYVVHDGVDNSAIGVNIRDRNNGTVVFADVYTFGSAHKLSEFELNSASELRIETRDYRFVNAFSSVQYAITDGSYSLFVDEVYEDGLLGVGELPQGKYFLLGKSSSNVGGNSLVEVKLSETSGRQVSRQLLTSGEGVVAARWIDISDGRYKLSMTDMNFPAPAAEIAIGLFGLNNDYRYIRYLPSSSAGVETEILDLDGDEYLLSMLIVPDAKKSALFGFQVDNVIVDEPSNSGDRGASGTGGGGGGGSLGLISLLLLLFNSVTLRLAKRFG